MRFRILRAVQGARLAEVLPPPLRRRLPVALVRGGPYTVVSFPLNQDPVKSGAVAKALERLGEGAASPVLAFAAGFTADALAMLASREIAAVTLSDFHWTDESYERIRRPSRARGRWLGPGSMAEAPEVVFSGDSLAVGGRRWRVAHPIADARLLDERVVVLYDPEARREPFGQFPNLVAFDLDGRPLWTAELPTSESGDRYVEIESAEPLRAYSWKSFSCELDPATGRLRRCEFRK